jgi:acetyl esterase
MTNDNRPVLDPRTQWFLQFLKDLGRPQVWEVTVDQARAMQVKGQELFPVTKLPAKVDDRIIPVGPRGTVQIRILRPEGATGVLPVVMYFHGGGWVLGDAGTYDRFLRDITNATGAAVVFVEYLRSPEETFPIPLEECYAAAKWVAEHGAEIKVDGSRMAVAGDSAGGNMATVVCHLAKQRGGPRILAQALLYPATANPGYGSQSCRDFGQGYYLTDEAMNWFWRQYVPDSANDTNPTAVPLFAPLDQLKELPPALIITAECDVLRDEGEAYARNLSQAGVPTTCTRYLGAIHGFMGVNALAQTPTAIAATAQMSAMLKKALSEKAAVLPQQSAYV